MAARSGFSPQALSVLAALSAQPSQWRHGYDLARQTGLKSGTLYPILGRLCDGGLLETRWEDDPPEGRPRRHLYRLTPAGAGTAAAALAARPRQSPAPALAGLPTVRVRGEVRP